jgi:hypothetical protein
VIPHNLNAPRVKIRRHQDNRPPLSPGVIGRQTQFTECSAHLAGQHHLNRPRRHAESPQQIAPPLQLLLSARVSVRRDDHHARRKASEENLRSLPLAIGRATSQDDDGRCGLEWLLDNQELPNPAQRDGSNQSPDHYQTGDSQQPASHREHHQLQTSAAVNGRAHTSTHG